MAADRRYRQQNRVTSDREKFYVYGNAVRQAEVQPKRRQEVRPAKTGKTSSQVMRNRNRAMKISPAYAIFFILAAVCTVAVCVVYIRLQTEVVTRSAHVTSMQEELADLTEAAVDSVNLDTVREKAMNEMGMVYESQGNVVEYKSPTSDYVKQYEEIPKDGVLAQSRDVSK